MSRKYKYADLEMKEEGFQFKYDSVCNGQHHCRDKSYNPENLQCKDCYDDAMDAIEETYYETFQNK